MIVRPQAQGDWAAVRALNEAAFDTPAEARLVDALREQAQPLVTLVAEEGGAVFGRAMFSPVIFDGHADPKLKGLAPMAVAPESQRRGIGSALVRYGIDHCREAGVDAIVVLSHPAYCPRFGFAPAARKGIRCEYDAPVEASMFLELRPGAHGNAVGIARYHAAFGAL
jgi:putative acetyltransferase